MKKSGLLLVIMMVMMSLVGCQKRAQVTMPKENMRQIVTHQQSPFFKAQQKRLDHFVAHKMVHQGGIYTNFRKVAHQKNVATGHEMLSESSGLWLEYLAQTHQYRQFREFYRLTKKQFDQGEQFSYRVDHVNGKQYHVNATLDDLRIIRSLQLYAQLTHSHRYRYEAAKRFALLKRNVISSGQVSDFYDSHTHQKSTTSSLAYYDLLTLHYFEKTTASDKVAYARQLRLVKNGYLGDAFPLYSASYDWKTKKYSTANLNMSENLETMLHLSEVHQLNSHTLTWLKQRVKQHDLSNGYSVTGVIVDRGQSAANYALAAMIFANENDSQNYQRAMALVWQSQVTDKDSIIYGALGDMQTKDAYSFNNLVALLASLY